MKFTLINKRQEVPNVTSFIFKSEAKFVWQAGQFLHYTLQHENQDDRQTERYFTISSAPHEDNVMLTTRFTDGGSSFKKSLLALPIGGTIEADGPEGDFVVTNPNARFVFIAGGIGITPYRSILLDLDKRGVSINARLLYSNRDINFVYKDELEALAVKHKNFTIRYFVNPAIISETIIREEVSDFNGPIIYVSGPEPMTEAFGKMLLDLGVPDANLKRDYFPGYNWP